MTQTNDKVTVRVDDRPVVCRSARPLFDALIDAGVFVQTACGGQGTCFLCRVTVVAGRELLPAPTAAEKRGLGNVLLAQHMRLACQIPCVAGLAIERPVYEAAGERRHRLARQLRKKDNPP